MAAKTPAPPDQKMLENILENPGDLVCEAKWKFCPLCMDLLCTHNFAPCGGAGVPVCLPFGCATACWTSKVQADTRYLKVHQNKIIMHQRFFNPYCFGTDCCIQDMKNAPGYVIINTSDIKKVKKVGAVPCGERYAHPRGGWCYFLCFCLPCCCPYADRFNFSGLEIEAETTYHKGWLAFTGEYNTTKEGKVTGIFLRHIENVDEISSAILRVAPNTAQ